MKHHGKKIIQWTITVLKEAAIPHTEYQDRLNNDKFEMASAWTLDL